MNARFALCFRFLLFAVSLILLAGCSTPTPSPPAVDQQQTVAQTENVTEAEEYDETTTAPSTAAPEPTEAPEATTAAESGASPQATTIPKATMPPEALETTEDAAPYEPSKLPTEEIIKSTPTQPSPATLLLTPATPAPTQTFEEKTATDGGVTLPTSTPLALQEAPAKAIVEPRLVELEYPETLRLGDSDIILLTLLPLPEGYAIQAEFPDHTTVTETVQVQHPAGYDLVAIARLDAVNFTYSPTGDQEQSLLAGEAVAWRWSLTPNTPGQQRLNVILSLRWLPQPGMTGNVRQVTAYSHSLDVRVISFLGLTRNQAALGGLFSLTAGGGLGLVALIGGRSKARKVLQAVAPNPMLVIEPRPGLTLPPHERQLLSALFQKYARLTIESEFLSGYSGARTFLAIPILPDGRSDAATIIKIGEVASIEREYHNYENFVKHSLPPVTARIQRPPISLPHRLADGGGSGRGLAALQYTFIGSPGQSPQSLRLALLKNPDSALLHKLFETFGPNWWMQRRPYTFRLALEYDHLLPRHFVVEPASGRGKVLDGAAGLAATGDLQAGDIVNLRGFRQIERRLDGKFSLRGDALPGVPPLRVRWLGSEPPNGASGRIISTRQMLLDEFTAGMDLFGLPDPLERLSLWLNETVHGSQSTIHGDLNLENILTGPGGFVWLIDFAQTREGHPLADFAHLEAEIIAHVIAPNVADPAEYLAFLNGTSHPPVKDAPSNARTTPYFMLRNAVTEIAAHCLLNPSQPREYELARLMACLGALKYANIDQHAKHLLYLTAAYVASRL